MKKIIISFLLLLLVNISCSPQIHDNWKRHNPQETGKSVVRGRLFSDELTHNYCRFPNRLKSVVRKDLFRLSQMSAGLSIRFHTNATTIRIRYTTRLGRSMHHMPMTGVSGVDLYTRSNGQKWLWCAGEYLNNDTIVCTYSDIDYSSIDSVGREYELLLPLYNQIEDLSIDTPHDANFRLIPISDQTPIIVYGTSIVQGACASRPGMAWSNIVARNLEIPIVNFGFSGNAFLEPEIIDIIIDQPSRLIILDNLANLAKKNSEKTFQLVLDAVHKIRKRSATPILLVDHAGYPYGEVNAKVKKTYTYVNEAQYKAFQLLQSQQVENLYYLSMKELNLSNDAFVDGIHPTDLGMQQLAEAYINAIRNILNK